MDFYKKLYQVYYDMLSFMLKKLSERRLIIDINIIL